MFTQNALTTRSGQIRLPAFLPDATFGQVRGVDAYDLKECGIEAVMMNAYHLMQKPGSSVISAQGGLHPFSGWDKPIFSDSGGFQTYSLIRQNSKFGNFSEDGILIKLESGKKIKLTPEKSMQTQFKLGADVLFCLDDCTHPQDAIAEQELSVQRTIRWAKHCKEEYKKLVDRAQLQEAESPKLFAVVQGGNEKELRRACADALLEIGFDGYGFGGWPIDKQGKLVEDAIAYLRELIPAQFPLHALGIGHPYNVERCFTLGYSLFDSAMPTRDARHGRLYRWRGKKGSFDDKWCEYVRIAKQSFVRNEAPISEVCDCFTCRKYSLGYLHHLYCIEESLYIRLATIHNLRFMSQVMQSLQAGAK